MNIASFLPKISKLDGGSPAISLGKRKIYSYAELTDRVSRLAGHMRNTLGLRTGDRIGIDMTNSIHYLEVLLATWHAGLCAVPLNAKLHPREVAYILGNCGTRLCFVTEDHAADVGGQIGELPALESILCVDDPGYEAAFSAEAVQWVDVGADDPAWIFYTSGTTGRPKGATLSHQNLMAMALRYYADIDELSNKDSYLHAAPMSHGGGLYGLPHMMKGSNQIVPDSLSFDVDEIFDLMEVYDNLTFFCAPTMLTRLTNHPRAETCRKEAIKTIYYGGAPMYLEDIKRSIARFGPRFYQIFGQGESPMTGIGLSKALHADYDHPRYLMRLASTGVARTGVDVRIVKENGMDAEVGELGEVLFRSDVVMTGYWNNPEATAAAIQNGWLHTGDIGCFDEDGFVTLMDRSKDMIISGGSNIYPREIEEVLMTDPRVDEVSVIGRPHPDWGEEVVAFVKPHAGLTIGAEELDRLCLDNIARFKRPKEYFFVTELPKSNYGKILKTELRKQVTEVSR